ncbi:MAG: tetratricopeptide repeat protein [Pseudohongiellaceae bacterium]
MIHRCVSKPIIATLCSLFTLILSTHSHAAELDRIGTFDFPTSGSPAAQEHFILGVGYLHSFGMTQAQSEFRRAQEIEPDFAMAYWGEAFTYQHPFFGQKDAGPGEALMRLGSTSEERLAKAPTEREKGFLRAAEAYALTVGDMPQRRTAWMNAMADLYDQYPDDAEVKAFYAASMLAGATAAENDRERLNMRAGALALGLFKENDKHPGAAHYVIHAFDDPVHAPIALEAATAYADIAPAVSHARHMPTHIFIQHGMWNEVSLWNDSAFNAGLELWQPGDSTGDMNHSSDWGQYGDLQLGDLEKSRRWIQRGQLVLDNDPTSARSISTVKTMKARHIIESKQWQIQPLSDDLDDTELLALGLSAASLGDLALANRVVARLASMLATNPRNSQIKLVHHEVAALTLHKESMQGSMVDVAKRQQAIDLMQEAMALKETQRPPNGAATPLKPVHELAAEMLLEMGQYEEAAKLFDVSLQRLPNRPWSLLGAARSYKGLNNKARASTMYHSLLAIWSDDGHPAVREAKQYLGY